MDQGVTRNSSAKIDFVGRGRALIGPTEDSLGATTRPYSKGALILAIQAGDSGPSSPFSGSTAAPIGAERGKKVDGPDQGETSSVRRKNCNCRGFS